MLFRFLQRKHNQIIAQVKGFPGSAKLSKKTAILTGGFNIPKKGFFPANKLISCSLRIIRTGVLFYNICLKTTFLHLTHHG